MKDVGRQPATRGDKLATRLLGGLLEDSHAFQRDNRDYLRFPASRSKRFERWVRNLLPTLADKAGYTRRHYKPDSPWLRYTTEHLAELEETYADLADEVSRERFVDVLKFRILGHKHVRHSALWPRFRRAERDADARHRTAVKSVELPMMPHWLNRYRIAGMEGEVQFDGVASNLISTFLLHQYDYGEPVFFKVNPGDIVVDGGGCWGDTALYFADLAGPEGRVFAFEFVQDNLRVLRGNLDLNPQLRERITVVERALWDRSDETMSFADGGGAGTTVGAAGTQKVETLAIDDLVEREKLPRVDFIKLDVEGAELRTLQGAERTLRAHRPNLAISAYHRQDDLVALPRFLRELDLGYRLYLDHFTIHAEETMLFATVR